jgi:outer membrane biosynthesis protein TonB
MEALNPTQPVSVQPIEPAPEQPPAQEPPAQQPPEQQPPAQQPPEQQPPDAGAPEGQQPAGETGGFEFPNCAGSIGMAGAIALMGGTYSFRRRNQSKNSKNRM